LAIFSIVGCCLISVESVASEVLWLKADSGVNAANSIPVDNTQLTQWFNLSNNLHHGLPARHHDGESNSAKNATLPSMPFFRYDQTIHMNFNPVIEFDASGDGHAIGFNTPAALDQTIFTVFKSAGTGRSQYEVGLLYGGDVSTPSGAGNPVIKRSDMSFGIGDSSRLSFGGGHDGDYFTEGDFSLFGLPSIGVLQRNVHSDNNVDYSIYANGAVDEINQNITNTGSGHPLSEQVRIGRHYSGGGSLNGLFAELIVFNEVLNDNQRHIVESYLAIKYGITLNPVQDTLGSSEGNNGYDYLNSAGNVIWQSENTDVFKYNVAGLGRDDFRQLDQRISRSVNYGSVLTVSTNTDFTSLNLANTRPGFNGNRDYIVWATDRSSVDSNTGALVAIESTLLDNPQGIESRVNRNWQVQLTNEDGSDIKDLSLEFDLKEMVNVGSVENKSLLLMVDNDKDGNYKTGNVSYYEVDLWANNKAQFDHVTLSTGDIFTIALKITDVQINTPVNATITNQTNYPTNGVCVYSAGDVVVSIANASPASKTVSCTVNSDVNAKWTGEWTTHFDVNSIADGSNTIIIDAAQNGQQAIEKTADKDTAPPPNTKPIIDLDASNNADNNYSAQFNEGDGAKNIADLDTHISDAEDANMSSATITLTNRQVDDVLDVVTLPSGISSSINTNVSGEITIILSGSASLTDYQNAISAINFSNTSQAPNTTPRILEVTVNDGQSSSAIATTTMTVTNTTDLFAGNDELSVAEDSVNNAGTVTGNDSTLSGAVLSYALANNSNVSNGSLIFNTNGSYVYTPSANSVDTDNFSYVVSDNITGEMLTQDVTIYVSAVTDLTAVNDSLTVIEDSIDNTATVATNDKTISGGALSFTLANDVTFGTLSFNNDGSYVYSPAANYVGNETFSYVVTDSAANETATVDVVITVTDVKDLTATNDTLSIVEDSADNTGTVTSNDATSSGAVLTYALSGNSNVSDGSLTFNTDGSYVYTPNANYVGEDNFSYVVSDGITGEMLTQDVTIYVSAVTDLTAVNDSLTVIEDSIDNTATVATNDKTISGGALSFTLANDVTFGTLSFNNDGSYVYSPAANYVGNETFSYVVTDAAANESATVDVVITVTDVNDLTAKHDAVTVNENSADNKSTVADNDNTTSGASLSYQLTNELNVQHGTLTFGADGSFVYTPDVGYFGEDSFSYSVTDPLTGEVFTETVTITVIENNNAPIAVNDYANTVNNIPVTVDILANDTDDDMAKNPLEKLTIVGATTQVGDVTWDKELLTYTPAVGFSGTATIDYAIEDSQGAVAQAVVYIDVSIDDDRQLPVITTPDDVFSDANALYTKLDLGTATATDRFGNPLPVSLIDGITFFEPGVNTAYWQATDVNGNVAVATQSVKVRPLVSLSLDQTALEGYQVAVGVHLNGVSPSYPLDIPFTVSGTALSDDHDLIDGIITIESGSEGVINLNIQQDNIFDDGETIIIELADSLNRGHKYSHTITINEDNIAPDLVLGVTQQNQERLTVTKGHPVVINSYVKHPVANKAYEYVWTSQQTTLIDIDSTESTFTFETSNLAVGLYHVVLNVIDPDDSNSFDKESVYIEVVDQLQVLTQADSDLDGIPDNVEGYADKDGDGIADYLDAVSECNVLPEKASYLEGYFVEGDPGVCLRRGDLTIGGETSGAQITADDIASDSDDLLIEDPEAENVGGIFDYIAYGLPDAGQSYKIVMPQIKPIPTNAVYRKLMPNDGWVTFTETTHDQIFSTLGEPGYCPPPGGDVWQVGLIEGHWCVQLSIADGGINDADGLVNSTVVDPGGVGVMLTNNTQPIAVNDDVETRHNTPVTVDVLTNDTDADNASLMITSATALFGRVDIVDGQLVYTPNASFIGTDIITYGVSDGDGGTDSAVVSVVVNANSPPVAVDDLRTMNADESLIIAVLMNDSDADNDVLAVSSATAQNGSITIDDDYNLIYIPNSGFIGDDTINYYIEDSFNGTALATVTVTVLAIPLQVKNSGSTHVMLLLLLLLCAAHRQYIKEK